MPTKINPDYKPSHRVAELLAIRFGLSNERATEFIGHELPAFMMYWEGTGKAKANWDSTCLNWMDRNYEQKLGHPREGRTIKAGLEFHL